MALIGMPTNKEEWDEWGAALGYGFQDYDPQEYGAEGDEAGGADEADEADEAGWKIADTELIADGQAGDEGTEAEVTRAADETETDPEYGYRAIINHSPENGRVITEYVPIEFCRAAAANAVKDICYRQGQGMLCYDEKKGIWREDVGDSRLFSYLDLLTDKYRKTWDGNWPAEYPGIKQMCTKMENPDYLLNTLLPTVKKMLTQGGRLFDADPYSINCGGIAVNLRAGKQRPARRRDYFTKSMAFTPGDPDKAVRFRQFLLEVCGGDESKAAWVLRWFCRAAVGETLDSYVLNLEGGGGNGKSVMVRLFRRLYGGYGIVLPQELAIKGEGGGGETARYMQGLEGARYGVLPDCGKGSLRISAIKRISGGDEVQARALQHERVTFTPCVSIVICSNVPLFLNETGEAMIRRWKTVRFEWKGKPDRLLQDRLFKEEGAAITGLIVSECGKYLADIAAGGDGFPPCEAIDAWAKAYIEERDPVKQFLEEHPEMFKNPVVCKTAWATYQRESEDYGDKYPLLHIFRDGMRAAGFVAKRLKPHNTTCWTFIEA
jgi:hypothetical protein